MPLLYPLKPRICQHCPTKAYWKHSDINTYPSSEPLVVKTTTLTCSFFVGGIDIRLKVGK